MYIDKMYLDVIDGIIMWKQYKIKKIRYFNTVKKFCFPKYSPLKAKVV